MLVEKDSAVNDSALHFLRSEAQRLIDRGHAVCLIDNKTKRPVRAGWPTTPAAAEDFHVDHGIGIVCGPMSAPDGRGLYCVDIDCLKALALADRYLPATGMIEGRPGKPGSHRYYLIPNDSIPPEFLSVAPTAAEVEMMRGHRGARGAGFLYADSKRHGLDFKATSGQAVCPPSLHDSGEQREWEGGAPGEPATVDFPVLWEAICQLATAGGLRIPRRQSKRAEAEKAVSRAIKPDTTPEAEADADADAHSVPEDWFARIEQASNRGVVTINGNPYTFDERFRRARGWLAGIKPADLSRSGEGGHDTFFYHLSVASNDFLIRDADELEKLAEFYNGRLRASGGEPWEGAELAHKIDDVLNDDLDPEYPPGRILTERPKPTALRNYQAITVSPGEQSAITVGNVSVRVSRARRADALQFELVRDGRIESADCGNPMSAPVRERLAKSLGVSSAHILHIAGQFTNDNASEFPLSGLPSDLPNDVAVKKTRVGRAVRDIAADAVALWDGNLRATESLIFTVREAEKAVNPDDETPLNTAKFADKPDKVFGLIAEAAAAGQAHPIDWAKGDKLPTKGEFVGVLPGLIDNYADVYSLPHHPPYPGLFYLNEIDHSKAGNGHLNELVGRFAWETDFDRVLIKAFFTTVVWGKYPGKRPAFLVRGQENDVENRCGVGKSTIAYAAGQWVNGYFTFGSEEGVDALKKRLFSDAGRGSRIILWDNIKTNILSSAEFEGLLTAPIISGHKLFTGEARRPNLMTYVLTMNDGLLGKDMSQRAVTVRLKRARYSAHWQSDTDRLVKSKRAELFAEAAAVIDRAAGMKIEARTRVPEWEQNVLAGCCESPEHFDRVVHEILRRQKMEDAAAEARRVIVAEIRAWVKGRQADPDSAVVELEDAMLVDATNRNTTTRPNTPKPQVMKTFWRTVRGVREIVNRESNGVTAYFWVGESVPNAAELRESYKMAELRTITQRKNTASAAPAVTLPAALEVLRSPW